MPAVLMQPSFAVAPSIGPWSPAAVPHHPPHPHLPFPTPTVLASSSSGTSFQQWKKPKKASSSSSKLHHARSTPSFHVPSPSPYPVPPASLSPPNPLPHAPQQFTHPSSYPRASSHSPPHAPGPYGYDYGYGHDAPVVPPLPPQPRNTTPLTRPLLIALLTDLGTHLHTAFGHQVTLLAHGGAVMVLHPDLNSRSHVTGTRDVDIVKREFVERYKGRGVWDAGRVLDECVGRVADKFGVGRDWMNGDPDVALPMAIDPVSKRTYDPIAAASLSTPDTSRRTLFSSPGLRLIAISWSWALALKFARYSKEDPADAKAVVRMLYWRYGENVADARRLESWLREGCWAMGYERWSEEMRREWRAKLKDAAWRAGNSRE